MVPSKEGPNDTWCSAFVLDKVNVVFCKKDVIVPTWREFFELDAFGSRDRFKVNCLPTLLKTVGMWPSLKFGSRSDRNVAMEAL
jgi:hypothetical protein